MLIDLDLVIGKISLINYKTITWSLLEIHSLSCTCLGKENTCYIYNNRIDL